MEDTNKNLRVVHILTSRDIDTDSKPWHGRTGFIDENMIKEEIPDYKDRVFYICGPPKMVETLVSILKDKLTVEDNRIRLERFAGY